MLRCSVVLVFLLLVNSLCLARAAQPSVIVSSQTSNENALIPDDDKAYKCKDTLEMAGIVIGMPNAFSEWRMTSHEFGMSIARLLPLLPPVTTETQKSSDLNAIRSDFHQKLAQSPAAIDAFLTLIHEFTPELLQMKRDQDIAAAETSLMEIHAVGQTEPAAKPSLAALLPADHWAYQAIDTLGKAGIVEYHIGGDQPYTGGKRLMNRYEFFVTLQRLRPLLQPVGTPTHADNAFYLPESVRSGNQKLIDTEWAETQRGLH